MFRFQHPAHAGFAARLLAGIGAENRNAIGFQLRHIALGRRVLPHLAFIAARPAAAMYGRATHTRSTASHRMRMRQFENEVGGAGAITMASAPRDKRYAAYCGDARIPLIGKDRLARQRLHRDGVMKAWPRSSSPLYGSTGLVSARVIRRLVAGHTAGQSQYNFFTRKIHDDS